MGNSIDFKPNKFSMQYKQETIEIALNISEKLFREIEEALIIITNNRGTLNIHE